MCKEDISLVTESSNSIWQLLTFELALFEIWWPGAFPPPHAFFKANDVQVFKWSLSVKSKQSSSQGRRWEEGGRGLCEAEVGRKGKPVERKRKKFARRRRGHLLILEPPQIAF